MTPSAPLSSAWLIATGVLSAVRTSTPAWPLAAPTACSSACRSNRPCWTSITIASGLAPAAISTTLAAPRLIQKAPSGAFWASRLRRLARVGSNIKDSITQRTRRRYYTKRALRRKSCLNLGLRLGNREPHVDLAKDADAGAYRHAKLPGCGRCGCATRADL